MTNTIHQLIAKDLESKMKVSPFVFHKQISKEMTFPTFKKIYEGKLGNSIPLSKYIAIYKALGEKEINISGEGVRLLVKIGY
jgi:hypothetical protein